MTRLLIRPPEPAVAQALEVLFGVEPVPVTVPACPRQGTSSFALAQPLGRQPQFPGGFRDTVGGRSIPHAQSIRRLRQLEEYDQWGKLVVVNLSITCKLCFFVFV